MNNTNKNMNYEQFLYKQNSEVQPQFRKRNRCVNMLIKYSNGLKCHSVAASRIVQVRILSDLHHFAAACRYHLSCLVTLWLNVETLAAPNGTCSTNPEP